MRTGVLLLVASLALLAVGVSARLHTAVLTEDLSVVDSSNLSAAFAEREMQQQWELFKKQYRRNYQTSDLEAHRYSIFKSNMATAAKLQAKNPEAKFGVTKFADLHPVEFKKRYLNFVPAVGESALLRQRAPITNASESVDALPAAFDWRAPDRSKPVGVTPVKDQGQCGSCWAFSATEAVESAWILSGQAPVALAPQQTVDCDSVDQGCNGGDTVTAYKYIEQAGGIEAEKSYPYTSGNTGNAGSCRFNKAEAVAKISGFSYATPGCDDACTNQNEALLKQNLYEVGPVSICVDAEPWQTYVSGVLTPASGCSADYNDLDHCVQLTGWGEDAGSHHKFWSVRNSWNTDWGEQGYIRILFGQNTCGVADEATQPKAA